MNKSKESKKSDPEKKDSSPAKQPLPKGPKKKTTNVQLSRNGLRNANKGQKKSKP